MQSNNPKTMFKTSIFGVLARESRSAVLFRRGSSILIRLISWDLSKDTFSLGQWLKARIRERRCDLTPDGKLLVYFVSNYGSEHRTWTAVSKPPYLTALMFCPKGDSWGGGGLFQDNSNLLLNHRSTEFDYELRFNNNLDFKILPLEPYSGRGEDFPIYRIRLLRDGWLLVNEGNSEYQKDNSKFYWLIDPAMEYRKKILIDKKDCYLHMLVKGIGERDHDNWSVWHELRDGNGKILYDFGRTTWADIDNNQIIFTQKSKVYRFIPKLLKNEKLDFELKELADFEEDTFVEMTPSNDYFIL